LEFLQKDLPKTLSSMYVGAERIREIVSSLRNFSRLDEAEYKTVDIHSGIDSTLMILQHRLREGVENQPIEVIKEFGNLPPIDCYPGQLNQVFITKRDRIKEWRPMEARLSSGRRWLRMTGCGFGFQIMALVFQQRCGTRFLIPFLHRSLSVKGQA
jgi:hypothetical protein